MNGKPDYHWAHLFGIVALSTWAVFLMAATVHFTLKYW